MVACYALESFHWNNGSTNVFVSKGSKRDTVTSPVAAAEPAKFTSAPPVASQAGGITGILAQYLVTYPNGPEL